MSGRNRFLLAETQTWLLASRILEDQLFVLGIDLKSPCIDHGLGLEGSYHGFDLRILTLITSLWISGLW